MCFVHAAQQYDGAPMPFPEPGVEPHYGPDRTARIAHLDLLLRIDPFARSVEGRGTYTVVALPTYRGVVRLDFADGTITDAVDDRGEPVPFTHSGEVVELSLPTPRPFTLRWTTKAPRAGMYFTGPNALRPDRQSMAWSQCQDEDAHFFLPCLDHPGDKHRWSIRLEGPPGYTLLSNGRPVASGEDEFAWATFEVDEPMPAYLFTAVVAKLTLVAAQAGNVPLRYLVPEGEDEAVLVAMGKTPLMIDLLERRTGTPFPWPRYDQVVVHDFIFGGMENVSCTTMTELLLVDEKAVQHYDPDGLVVHELAHQWFGDLVTCQDWSQAWLNESFATWVEQLWWEEDRPADEAVWYRWATMREYLDEDRDRYRRPIVAYRFREPIDVFDRHLYQKGACVLHTLRVELGDEGFFQGVKTYLERHRHGTVHTRHLQRAMEDATGRNLDGFFSQWVFRAGHPVVAVELGVDGDLLTVDVTQTQDHPDTEPAFAFTLRLEVVTASGTTAVRLPIRERKKSFVVPVTSGPVQTVRVDPGLSVLADITLTGPVDWLVRLTEDACPVLASRALAALAKTGTPRGTAAVVAALRAHPFWGVRATAAERLSHAGPSARQALVDALAVEAHPRARKALCAALGEFKDAAAADALVGVLAGNHETWHVEAEALVALAKTADPRAESVIAEHFRVVSWGSVVEQHAAWALAETKKATVLDALLATSRGPSDRVRAGAAKALGVLGDHLPDTRRACSERLCEMTREEGFRALVAAVDALGKLREPSSASALHRVHETAADGRVRRLAYEALVKVREGRSTDAGLMGLRARVEELAAENAKLRERIDRLELSEQSAISSQPSAGSRDRADR